MKAFLFSDLHDSYSQLKRLENFLVGNDEIDILIFAGDVVNMGEPVGFMVQFINLIDRVKKPFFWVPGNNDFGPAYYKLKARYPSLEGRVAELPVSSIIPNTNPLIRFTGVGGSPASWAGQYQGENMIDKKMIAGSIFISHVPPPGILNWQKFDVTSPTSVCHSRESGNLDHRVKPEDDRPRGRRFTDSPEVHICGHIHHQWGVAYLGQTKVIKLAAIERGYYAILDLESLKVEFERW